MKLLLDTHALIWWLADDPALSAKAKRAIENQTNDVLVSAASAFEVATKSRIGKLPEASELARNFETIIAAERFQQLSISVRHAVLAGSLKAAHKDPFDRMLIAQSLLESVTLTSNEHLFDSFGVVRLW